MQLISRENTMEDLVQFVKSYVGAYPDEYKIPLDQIPDYLPPPLKILYHEFGNFPSFQQPAEANPTLPLNNDDNTAHLFHNQDALVYFQYLKEEDNRVVFAWENQGNWTAETETFKEDPPVYSDAYLVWSEDTGLGKIEICPRLSHFLATFCLRELICGSRHFGAIDHLELESFIPLIEQGTPVWLDGTYTYPGERHSFYMVEGNRLLVTWNGVPSFIGSNQTFPNAHWCS